MSWGDRDYRDVANPGLRTTDTERPIRSAATPGHATGELNSQHRVSEHPAGFRVRERGALSSHVTHCYRCPVHGEFDAKVPRDSVPDEMPCSHVEDVGHPVKHVIRVFHCGLTSPWAGSHAGQGFAAGEVTC